MSTRLRSYPYPAEGGLPHLRRRWRTRGFLRAAIDSVLLVSVHKVSDGKVSLWKDYWDLNAIANTTWFQSSLAAADMSWVFDATGLV